MSAELTGTAATGEQLHRYPRQIALQFKIYLSPRIPQSLQDRIKE